MPLGEVSPGTKKRNFTHVDDIINGLFLVGEKGIGDDYRIGNDESYSILEIANLFGGEIIMLFERKGNRLLADIMNEKTIKLGWKTQKSIKKYIKNLK